MGARRPSGGAAALALAALCGTACTTIEGHFQRLPSEQALRAVEPGVTTRSEVLRLLGPPEEMRRPAVFIERAPTTAPQRRRILEGGDLLKLQAGARRIRVTEKLVDYILVLAETTRESSEFALPVSTRGVQGLYRASQALAMCEGRDYVVPDDVQRLAVPVLGHRVVLKRGAGGLDETRDAIRRILASTPVPL